MDEVLGKFSMLPWGNSGGTRSCHVCGWTLVSLAELRVEQNEKVSKEVVDYLTYQVPASAWHIHQGLPFECESASMTVVVEERHRLVAGRFCKQLNVHSINSVSD